MNWNDKSEYQNWNGEISNIEEKMRLAEKISELVKDGQTIGFGSGSTSFLAIKKIAEKIQNENIKITAIPTSYEVKLLCSSLGIPTASILEMKPDWSFDGADEVNSSNWLIKGRGAAMFKEKINIANSEKVYILIDSTKVVDNLGKNFSIPVECYPETIEYVKEQLYKLGAKSCELRKAKGKDGPVITENNNFVIDAKFESIQESLERDIKNIIGVIESGLFIGYKNIEIMK